MNQNRISCSITANRIVTEEYNIRKQNDSFPLKRNESLYSSPLPLKANTLEIVMVLANMYVPPVDYITFYQNGTSDAAPDDINNEEDKED